MPVDDFILVKKKKKSRRITDNIRKVPSETYFESGVCNINKDKAVRKILLTKEEVAASDFYYSLQKNLSTALKQLGKLEAKEIICYGLGHFAECVGPRYQFGLLLSLKDHFSANVLVYDPIFYDIEIDILGELGCQIILVNEEGKHKTKPNTITLIYQPHCPKQLTNNFLWANWGPELTNCVIFSNSFSKIVQSQPKRVLNTSAEYILNIIPYTEELSIDNCFRYKDIFNDLAIHIFPQKKLNSVTQALWTSCEEPKYTLEDTEFITQKLNTTLKIEN